MKRILAVMSAILILFLSALPLFSSSPMVITDSHYKKIKITNGVFPEDCLLKINTVKIQVDKGFSYESYCSIRDLIKSTPSIYFGKLDLIILTTRHPFIAITPNPSKKDIKAAKDNPLVLGNSSDSKSRKVIAIRDSNEVSTTYLHEFMHYIDSYAQDYGVRPSESSEFQDITSKIYLKGKTSSEVGDLWLSKQSEIELFAYIGQFIYDNNPTYEYYHDIISKNYPEAEEYYEMLFKELEKAIISEKE